MVEELEELEVWEIVERVYGSVLDILLKEEINLVVDYFYDKMNLKYFKEV